MFFIAALPRSRTAWLASFLTTGESTCLHDLSRSVGSVAHLRTHLRALGTPLVGVADTGLCLGDDFAPAPGERLIVIERHPDVVMASMRAAFPFVDPRYIEATTRLGAERLRELANAADLVIPYDRLDDESIVRRLWAMCVPMVPWDKERYALWTTLRMTIDPSRYAVSVNPDGLTWLRRRLAPAGISPEDALGTSDAPNSSKPWLTSSASTHTKVATAWNSWSS